MSTKPLNDKMPEQLENWERVKVPGGAQGYFAHKVMARIDAQEKGTTPFIKLAWAMASLVLVLNVFSIVQRSSDFDTSNSQESVIEELRGIYQLDEQTLY